MPLTTSTEHVLCRNTQVFNHNFAVVVAARHGVNIAHNSEGWVRQIDNETRVCCLRKIRVFLGTGNEQCKLCTTCSRNKPLVTIDDPFVAITVGKSFDECRVASCNLWFGHSKTRTCCTFTQRTKILFLLLWSTPVQQRVLISFVWSLSIQYEWPDTDFCCFRRHCCHGCRPKTHAAPLCWHMGKPEMLFVARLLAQTNNRFHHSTTVALIGCVPCGSHNRVHEIANFQANLFYLSRKRKINHLLNPINL